MPSIALITTGECEHRALGASLQRVFGVADLELVVPFRKPIPSITSNYLGYPGPTSGETQVDKLVASIMATIERRDAPDFAIAIDDLELANVATAHHVTQLVADGFRRYLGATPTHRELTRVRERCSFHLLCPMLETYFFASLRLCVGRAARDPRSSIRRVTSRHFGPRSPRSSAPTMFATIHGADRIAADTRSAT